MKTITISKDELRKKFFSNAFGYHKLSIDEGSSAAEICFHECGNNRGWGCGDFHIADIPEWNPEGSGRECDAAIELLKDMTGESEEELHEFFRQNDIYPPDYVAENYPTEWKELKEAEFEFRADQFICLLNGEETDIYSKAEIREVREALAEAFPEEEVKFSLI